MSGLAPAHSGLRFFALLAILAAIWPGAAAAQQQNFQPAEIEQPFGFAPRTLSDGGLVEKWRTAQARIQDDLAVIMLCRADPAGCPSPAALNLLVWVEEARQREGLARLGEINRAVNMSIRFASDSPRFGQDDVWTSALETLELGTGDCEDYALLKLTALNLAGVSQDDLRLVILQNKAHGDDHAVAAVRFEGEWRILNNQHLLLLRDWQVTGHLARYVVDAQGVHAYADPNVAWTQPPLPQPVQQSDAYDWPVLPDGAPS